MGDSSPTPSTRAPDRGQTPQDFALGVGLFIIVVGFTFAFLPSAFMFTGADPGPTEMKQAERTSMALISNLSVGENQNTLNATGTADFFNQTDTESELQSAFDLSTTTNINVTIQPLNYDDVVTVRDSNSVDISLTSGTTYPPDRPAAEVVRIVRIVDQDGDCVPGCRLVVKVW